jgi:uncharacterized protein (DUF427 family)
MPKAIWKDIVLAESEHTEMVEGNHYFPPDTISSQYFRASDHHTVCPWKGRASYYDIEVDGQINRNAAWCYPQPSRAAQHIKNHVAFWRGVRVVD